MKKLSVLPKNISQSLLHILPDVFCDDEVSLYTDGESDKEGEREGWANIGESWWKINGWVSIVRFAGFITAAGSVFDDALL